MMLVDDFSAVLKRKMGLDSGSIGAAAVERAVRHRMQSVGSDDEHDYLMRLQTSPAEMQQLIEAVIVPETWFFRYPESQAAMAALARERLFAPGAEARQLRVLSVPCSSGEEPYSIAMALLDAGVPAERFQVDAVDISERMVAFARRACYGRNSFRGESLSYRDRYFTETADGHQLTEHVTARVRLLAGNLFDPALLPNAAPYDFVFCRNLLIYFDAPTQERAVTVLRRFARHDGILFVGPAETSLMTGRRLPAVPLARAFAFRAEPAPPTEAAPARTAGAASGRATPPPVVAPRAARPWMPAARPQPYAPAAPARPHAASPAPHGTPAQAGQDTAAALREIAALADQGRVRDALAQCRAHLERHGASAEALYLLGLLQDADGDTRAAQAAYRKALYLDPAHREALLHLAALIAAEGDHEGARRLQARAACRRAPRARRPAVSDFPDSLDSLARLAEVDDCWNRIGIRGDKRCERLAGYVHCRNCPVYADAAKRILDRLPPQAEGVDDGAGAAQADRGRLSSLLVFRLQGEWLGLPTKALDEVAGTRPILTLPHRRDPAVLGVTNMRGTLTVCVSLGRLLGLEGRRSTAAASGRPRRAC